MAHEAGDGAQQARLSRTVGAEKSDDLAVADLEGYATHGRDGSVVNFDVLSAQHE
jgi:hypothetical protein